MGNVCWKDFRMGDLFNFVVGCQPSFKDRFLEKSAGMVPVITGVTTNNGVGFYTVSYGKKTYKDILTVSKDGEYAGTVFLQSEEVYLGGHSLGLIPKFVFDNRALLFVASAILKYQKCGFWKLNNIPSVQLDKIKKIKIFLPVKLDGTPDWDYMAERIRELEAERIRELEAERIRELEAYFVATGLNDYELTEEDKQVLAKMSTGGGTSDPSESNESITGFRWKKFRLGDLFNIHSPVKKFNANKVSFNGKYPYVARGTSNNGIRGYIIEDVAYLNPAHTLSFGQDTATVYYQSKPYFTGDKIKIMELKNVELTESIAAFLVSAVRKAFLGFTWGQNLFNEKVINNIEVILPVGNDNQPDWDYMERYICAMEKLVIADAVKWKDQQVVITKQIMDKGIA